MALPNEVAYEVAYPAQGCGRVREDAAQGGWLCYGQSCARRR
ncbi:hypothetical protein [Mycolicibacterium pallens]|nr:hypothetical protein [Mycolicibacterium pallens]